MLILSGPRELAAVALALAMCAAAGPANAGNWLAPGDAGLRDDLARLVDESVINLPLTAWPVHEDAVRAALDALPADRVLSVGQQAALSRLRLALDRDERTYSLALAHRPNPIRIFADEPRDEAGLGLAAEWDDGRWSARLDVTAVADPSDGQAIRPDGSYVSGRIGNWAVTAGWLERWWGPGWNGSLLLGTAARPVPAVSLDRAVMAPFETRWLSWLGPWTVNAFAGAMEGHRQDRDHPILMGLRVAARPLNGLEIALERTAQWCAAGLPCDLSAFGDVLLGNDNQSENVTPEDEPGNQLAGWSARWSSPLGNWPYAIYAQSIGEAMGKRTIPWPVQRLSLQGIEVWGTSAGGAPWRVYVEYADTTCHVKVEEFFDCAYNNGLFPVEGYRFRGRPVGHALDGDGRMYSVGMQVRSAAGADWQLLARRMDINRGGGVPDLSHTLSPVPVDAWEAQVRVDFDWLGGRLAVGLAAERQEPEAGPRDTQARAFARYQRPF